MAEEENAQSTKENLIEISPEFANMVSEIAASRKAKAQDPEVEGHALSVEEFGAPGRTADTICGLVYGSN